MSSIWLSPKDTHRETRGQAASVQDQLNRKFFRRPDSWARTFRPMGLPGWASMALITMISGYGLYDLMRQEEAYYPLRLARKLEQEDAIQQAYLRRWVRFHVWRDVWHQEAGLRRHGQAAQTAKDGTLPPLSLWPLLAGRWFGSDE